VVVAAQDECGGLVGVRPHDGRLCEQLVDVAVLLEETLGALADGLRRRALDVVLGLDDPQDARVGVAGQ
jgi:hypothetical protein